ncbi:phenylacetate-coenzyme A ligase [Halalkalibacter wakoensis JCM 9140]|uniref:Phenylacetate-coenzyme A ligase n=1 Tax=Halalkalibacter wakoensis JCM 9140 TaxID=1236970 RepID=W4PZM4_9BACI|nr:AMP-binding protein [Halalkalibacter wakoensis]GAE24559.1 phenylacetate-coenzyme A ligase [Halalkalibacter wakoensis JCM 9140]
MTDRFYEPYESLIDLQERKLRKQIRYVYEHSPFYQKKMKEQTIKPTDITCLNDLQKLPFTYKNEIRESQKVASPLGLHAAVPLEEVVRVHSSSGTTGRPTYVGITRHDYDVWTEILARVLHAHGIRKESRVVFAMGLSFFVGSSMKDGIERLGATFIPIGTGASDRVIQSIQDFKADVLFCTPSYASYLAEYVRQNYDFEPSDLGLKIISVGGEPGGGLPEVRNKIQQDWGAKVLEAMGNADMAPVLFSECQERAGMHFVASDYVICEIIDPETGEVVPHADRMEGELVYTAIDRECSPLLRFRTRDLVQVDTTPCTCGRKSFRIKCVGRTDDMLIIRGVNVFPSAIKDVVNSFRPRTNGEMSILLKEKPPLVHPPLPIQVEYEDGLTVAELAELKKEIESMLRSKLTFTADVQLVSKGTLPRFEMKSKLIQQLK